MLSVISGGLRLASLSLRMVLMLFMAKYLSFADIGVFSLIVGTAALLPGAAGLGLSYFVNREIVGGSATDAHLLARDRLIVTLLCGTISALGAAALAHTGILNLVVDLRVFGGIIILNMISFDLQLLLIARHRAKLANFLLFLRSSGWIPFFMLLALADPMMRDVDVLLRTWLAGEVAAAAVAVLCLRHVLRRPVLTHPFDFSWLRQQFPRALPIWISDFSLAMSLNIDRFIISLFIGVEATGIYFFFFSIGSAAFQIVQSAAIQPYMPKMRESFRGHATEAFTIVVDTALKRVAYFSGVIAIFGGIGTFVLVHFLQRGELNAATHLIFPIMLGVFAKSINEFLGIVDYVTENDTRYISLNIAALIVTPLLLGPATLAFGLTGAAIAFLLTMSIFASLRWKIWGRESLRACAP